MAAKLFAILASASIVMGGPLLPRTVTSLDEAATAEAQQVDPTAVKAFSNVQIKTGDGRCLFIDKLSGDFRENLTPIQVAACGSTSGQGFDLVTKGKHNNVAGAALIVSTLTNACCNFDPRRAAGNQALMFSCGGRADGGGAVTNSQLFNFNGSETTLALEPQNAPGTCFTVKGNVVDVANCNAADKNQQFTFGGAAAGGGNAGAGSGSGSSTSVANAASTTAKAADKTTAAAAAKTTTTTADAAKTNVKGGSSSSAGAKANDGAATSTSCPPKKTRTVTATAGSGAGAVETKADVSATAVASSAAAVSSPAEASSAAGGTPGFNIPNPTDAVPVSGSGGKLNPTAAAEANARDDTAVRAFTAVEIRADGGQCISVNPTAGDFRENLIPVSLVDCSGSPNEKWDIVIQGKHNNKPGTALIVSTLMNGCISLDLRRQPGDTVTVFSCGGRGDGSGETNADQLMPFIGEFSFAFAPTGENNKTCILPGDAGRLTSGPCPTTGAELFSIFP